MRIISRCFALLALTAAAPLLPILPHLGTRITRGLVSYVSSVSGFLKKAKPKCKPRPGIMHHGYKQQVSSFCWGIFISASVKVAVGRAAPALLQCEGPWLSGYLRQGLLSWGSSPAAGQGRGCVTVQGCLLILSRGSGAVSLPAGLTGDCFHRGFDSQENNIFPTPPSQHASLLFGPSIGKYLPYEST